MNDITKKYFYKKFIIDLLELDENTKYSLLFIYIRFRDIINNNNYKKIFKAYSNIQYINYYNLDRQNKLISYIFENFTIKYKYCEIDKGIIIKNIII